jgi:alkylation response protein AidB-like acyl-CoA dehydrogenase
MEIHGGYGVMRDVGLEKLVRDALTMLHPDATNTALRIAIGDALSKGH